MIERLTLQQIASACGGRIQGGACEITRISTDTRSIEPGDLFVAIRGERFDGHSFVSDAVARGAGALLVDHSVELVVPQVIVKDTVQALGLIAREVRRKFTGTLIGLTGSCGKTSVKELLASILGQMGSVCATKGNLNNHIGVPFTLFDLSKSNDFAVVEMGASGPGEIAWLAEIAEPQIALVNNVMAAHLEGFGTLQGVAEAKGEIYQGLGADGTAVINRDDAFADQWLLDLRPDIRALTFSVEGVDADFRATDIKLQEDACAKFTLHTPIGHCEVALKLVGRQQVANSLAAATCAFAAGADLESICRGLQVAEAVAGRMQPLSGRFGGLIINDTYNANPGSVRAAIDSLAALPLARQKWLVLGALAELGPQGPALMTELGLYAREAGLARMLCVGESARPACDGFGPGAVTVPDQAAAIYELQNKIDDETVVLIKGSRSARMEVVVQALTASGGQV